MANISSKISSIEPEDNPAEKPMVKPESTNPAPDAKPLPMEERVPDFLIKPDRPLSSAHVPDAPSFGWINVVIILSAVLWVITALVIAYSFFDLSSGLGKLTTLQWASLALFVFGPILMLLVTGYALRQLARLSAQAHTLAITSQHLITPDETAVSRTGLMASKIRGELDNVSNRVDTALSRMAALQETLDFQLQAINRSTYITDSKTDVIASRLKEERDALTEVSTTFEKRMNALSSVLDTHSENLARSTHAAEQKIQEARISVEGATAKINSASELVLSNTIEAASKLENNQAEIARLGDVLKVRATELDGVYTKHAADLAAMISDLRDEQENLGVSLEARLQKMREMSLTAQVSAQHLEEASTSGRQTVEALADAARLTDSAVKQRFADMEDMVKYSNARAESISQTAARRVQDSLGQTRKEIARIEYDMVALQEKLRRSTDAAPSPQDNAPIDRPREEAPRRKGIPGLKPLTDDLESETAQNSNSEESTPRKNRLSGLRPAPETVELFEGQEIEIPDIEFVMDEPTESPELLIPNFDDPKMKTIVSVETHQELVLAIPTQEDIIEPDPNQEVLDFGPSVLRRTVPDDEHRRGVEKDDNRKSWWRGLFGGRESETSAIDQLTHVTDVKPKAVTDGEIIMKLSSLGLSPGAVVDDGCIIEAVNTRISKGPLAMSDVITHRLEDPVHHLYGALAGDPELKASLTAFARRFHTGLTQIEDDREAIRSRFESDAGRAFLLCDAALNR